MRRNKIYTVLLILLALVCLQGCQQKQSLPNALDKYHERIYRVLDIKHDTLKINSSLSFPAKSATILSIPPLNINMREFYAIENCAIKQLIAERNTALGKIQLPSVRLQYEWTLISHLKSCIQNMATQKDPMVIDKLRHWLKQKEQVFELAWANMLTQSNEVHLAFSSASGFIEGNESDDISAGLFDLANIIAIKEAPAAQIKTMELSLQSMQKHRIYARLWRSQLRLKVQLEKMTLDISKWQATFACRTNKDRDKLAIIRNVFTLFFIQEIQAIAAKINHYHYLLKPEFMKIINEPVVPDLYRKAIEENVIAGFDDYQNAVLEHVRMWQVILKKCD